jgi:hypothetical protein
VIGEEVEHGMHERLALASDEVITHHVQGPRLLLMHYYDIKRRLKPFDIGLQSFCNLLGIFIAVIGYDLPDLDIWLLFAQDIVDGFTDRFTLLRLFLIGK